MERDTIAVIDFGAQYSQLIARRVRELGVYAEILPHNAKLETYKGLKGIIFSGGPASVTDPDSPHPYDAVFSLGLPILGICYGLQLIAQHYNIPVVCPNKREYGIAKLHINKPSLLLDGVSQDSQVWMSHGDAVSCLPEGFESIGSTDNCPMTAIEDQEKGLYGVQFHPEVVHSTEGKKVIENFVFKACKAKADWSMDSFIGTAVKAIQDEVGPTRRVLCGLSGGVDSSVVAALIHKAIGDRLICVFVNNGMLRKGEAQEVIETFRDNFKIPFYYCDATDLFLNGLKGLTEPESKRKTIGKLFVQAFYDSAREVQKQFGEISYLAQGTLYPDVIESRSAFGGPSSTIKSHHNVGGLPADLAWKLLEPLKDLFKDEVREVGKNLGLPEKILGRHPFPGPGLGIRCIGEVTKERLDTLRDVDAIFIEEIRKAGLYNKIWQALADLLPVKSVGVQGDHRTYEEVCSLRAVTSEDAMTADWYPFPPQVLQTAASRICNEVPRVNRVLYDITQKPPGTIEWE